MGIVIVINLNLILKSRKTIPLKLSVGIYEKVATLIFLKTSFEGELAPFSLWEWNGCQAFIDPMSQAFWISVAKVANFTQNKNVNKYYFLCKAKFILSKFTFYFFELCLLSEAEIPKKK